MIVKQLGGIRPDANVHVYPQFHLVRNNYQPC